MTDTDFTEDHLPDEPREDKIFNNSYYNGDKLRDSEQYEFQKKNICFIRLFR